MSATVNVIISFESVTNNFGATAFAPRRKLLDSTLETVECVSAIVHHDLERFVVDVAAFVTSSHFKIPPVKDLEARYVPVTR